MGRLDALKAAMIGANAKMGHDLGSVDTSVLNKSQQAPEKPVDLIQDNTKTPAAETDTPVASATAKGGVDSLYDFYVQIASSFSRMHEEVLQQNQLVVLRGLPDDVRKVSLESMMFIANHFGYLMAALILDYKDIRNVFTNALLEELDLLEVSADQRKIAHEKNGGYGFDDNDHPVELGISRFTQSIELNIVGAMRSSMSVINNTKLADAIDDAFENKYEQKDADDLGALLSNPVFLLVVLNNNATFVYQVAQICDALKAEYEIS